MKLTPTPFSKPYKERAPGTRHRGPGKNNKVRMTKTQQAIENGTIEQKRQYDRERRMAKKTRKGDRGSDLFKMAQAKLREEARFADSKKC